MVSPRSTRAAEPDRAQRQVDVVQRDQDLGRDPSLADQLPERFSAPVHVGLRLHDRHRVPAGAPLPAQEDSVAPPSGESSELLTQDIHRHEAGVVARPLVLGARIAETQDDLGLVNLSCLPPWREPWPPCLPWLLPPLRLPRPSSRRSLPARPRRPLPQARPPRESSAAPPPRWRGRLPSGSRRAPP